MLQWLRIHASSTGGVVLIPGQGTKIPHVLWSGQGKKKKAEKDAVKNNAMGTSLMVQWLRIHLQMQETQVQSLVWEYPTCFRATKPMNQNY